MLLYGATDIQLDGKVADTADVSPRRIKNSASTKNNFLASTSILHFLLSIASVLIVFGLFFVFFLTMKDPKEVREQVWSNINIGGLIYSILLLIVSSLWLWPVKIAKS